MNNIYMYRLRPPRPDFPDTMSEQEMQIMGAHAEYWTKLMDENKVLIFTPVPDPEGAWGMALVLAPDLTTVEKYGASDPATASGLMTFSILELSLAVTPDRLGVPD